MMSAEYMADNPATSGGHSADIGRKAVIWDLGLGFGNGTWVRHLGTAFGNGIWKRYLGTGFGNGIRQRDLGLGNDGNCRT